MRRVFALAATFALLLGNPGGKTLADTLASSASGVLAAPSSPVSTSTEPVPGGGTPAPAAGSVPIHSALPGSRLFAVPLLEPGKRAWVTVYDHAGRPEPAVSVLINGSPVDTDSMGQSSFDVPKVTGVTISLSGPDGKPFSPIEYAATPNGLLVSEANMREAADRIEDTVVSNEMAPAIAYAPAVVESNQPFVVIGKNLSGNADDDHLLLDGYDADVFSGSSVCLLATPPRRLEVGPLREMYVSARGETSNTVEVDVCRVEFALNENAGAEGETGKVKVIGTNVPALVILQNLSPDVVGLAWENRTLGAKSAFVSPGGENNCVAFSVKQYKHESFDLDTHIVADAPWSPDDRTVFGDNQLRKIVCELNKAEIIRLKRRLIALEARINQEEGKRTSELSAGTMDANQLDKYNSELRALSNRRHRINTMITTRRSVFYVLGGSDAEYRQALEEATGGAVVSLEKELSPITSAALLATTTAPIQPKHQDAEVASTNVAEEQQLEESMAALTNMWKKMPAKVGHNTRLAPPPEPYIPKVSELGPGAGTANLSQLIRLNHLPPPPPVLAELLKAQRKAGSARSRSIAKNSRKRAASHRHKHR